MSNVIHVSDQNFDAVVAEESKPVLIDFWAPWCGHCTRIAPVLDEIASDLEREVKCVKVNVDENSKLAEQFGIMMLPTLVVAKQGKEVDRIVGATDKQQIVEKIKFCQ